MSRLVIESRTLVEQGYDTLAQRLAQRITAMPAEQCPVDYLFSLACMFSSESCGKCTPCRVGLRQIMELLTAIMEGEATEDDVELLNLTSQVLFDSADCAIGFEAGRMMLQGIENFQTDIKTHVEEDRCSTKHFKYAPCQAICPAHVDIPGYISLIRAGHLEDAVRVIRNDNPLPSVCGYVCEHPCEMSCRRDLVDSAVNICGLKRYAADNASVYEVQENAPETGKSVGIIGGGPAGLTAAYYLQLMGHAVTIYETREKLGGMVRYGIPDYRLPQEKLDADIDFILSTGIKSVCNTCVGADITLDELREKHDALCLSIGAHAAKKLVVDGEDAKGVLSAVEFLRAAGEGAPINLSGAKVCVIGGGNVAMDCTRTAKRLGAASVECVYRRRIEDMTALAEEIEEAMAENCQISPLMAPVAIKADENNNVCGLVVQPQMISAVKRGRPAPVAADVPQVTIPCDVVLVAIGQAIQSKPFESLIQTNRGQIITRDDGSVIYTTEGDGEDSAVSEANATATPASPKPHAAATECFIYAGGDAVSGPATVIKAIAQGKVAAANIDAALGFNHNVSVPVNLPAPEPALTATGRIDLKNRKYAEAAADFEIAKCPMSKQEADQESARCLRCDFHGFGAVCDKEVHKW